MPKEQPLAVRLYFDGRYADLARIVGYQSLSIKEAQEKALPLGDKYGKERVQAAADEILHFDHAAGTVRLKTEVRKLCSQLLGLPPEMSELFSGPPAGSLALRPETNVTSSPVPKRSRKKKGEASCP